MGARSDEIITAVPGKWRFNKAITKGFDSHVRKSVPLYDEFQDLVVRMSEWFVRDGDTVCDIGSSTGETIALLRQKHADKKNISFCGYDNSRPMVAAATKKAKAKNVRFVCRDVADVKAFPKSGVVVSLFTLQFLTLKARREVLKRIYTSLREGGALIIAEKVCAGEAPLEDVWLELHWDFKRRQGLTDEQILNKARGLRGVLVPLTLDQNIQLLKDVGFTFVDTYLKWCNFAGVVAVKSAPRKTKKKIGLPAGRQGGTS